MRGTKDDRHSNEYISLREVDPLDPSPSFCRLSAGPISSALMERPEDWVTRARVCVCVPFLFWHQLVRAQHHVREIRGKSIALFEFHGALKEKVWIISRSVFFLVFWWHSASTRESTRPTEFCILGRELKVFQMLIHTYSAMVSSRKGKYFFSYFRSQFFYVKILLRKK